MNRSQNNRRPSGSNADHFDEETLYAEKLLLKKRQKGLFRTSIIFFVLVIAIILLYFAARALFRVDSFTISGNTRYSDEQIIEACGIEYGTFMFSFASSDVEQRLAMKCPYVEKAVMRREYPSALIIDVSETSAQFVTKAADKYIAFSKDLKVLEVADDNKWGDATIAFELPQISIAIEGKPLVFSSEEKIGHITDFIKALEFYDSEYELNKVDLTESYSIKMYCGDRYELLLGKSEELDVKMRTVSKLLRSETITQSDGARIDVSNPKEPSFLPIDVE